MNTAAYWSHASCASKTSLQPLIHFASEYELNASGPWHAEYPGPTDTEDSRVQSYLIEGQERKTKGDCCRHHKRVLSQGASAEPL